MAFIVLGFVAFTIVGPQAKGHEPLIYKLFTPGGHTEFLQAVNGWFHR
jgi:hypothetical protein